jgi:hypothetical protein
MTKEQLLQRLEKYQKQYRKGLISLEELNNMTLDDVWVYFSDNNKGNREGIQNN